MVQVRLPEDSGPGTYRHRSGLSVEQGETVDVDEEMAKYLVEEWSFERVDGENSEDEDAGDGEDNEAEEFDAETWLDQDYQERADAVEAGEVDEHLDAIAEAETSDTVIDAVGQRRAEIEGSNA